MEKYTVDLDKVLNDFEYSEYSLESAKSNRNVPEETPNASFNSSYSVRNETTSKHSINNVFHSLNEYLNSDITPKKLDNSKGNVEKLAVKKYPTVQPQIDSGILPKTIDAATLNDFTNTLPRKTDLISDIEFSNSKGTFEDIPIEDSTNSESSNVDSIPYESLNSVEGYTTRKINEVSIPDSIKVSEEVLVDLSCDIDKCDKNIADINLKQNKIVNSLEIIESEASEDKSEKSLEDNADFNYVLFQNEDDTDDSVREESAAVKSVNEENSTIKSVNEENSTIKSVNEENSTIKSVNEENSIIESVNEGNSTIEIVSEENPTLKRENEENLTVNSVKQEIPTIKLVEEEIPVIQNVEIEIPTIKIINEEISIIESDKEESAEKIESDKKESPIKIGFKNDVHIDEENIDAYFQELEKELEPEISKSVIQSENSTIIEVKNIDIIKIQEDESKSPTDDIEISNESEKEEIQCLNPESELNEIIPNKTMELSVEMNATKKDEDNCAKSKHEYEEKIKETSDTKVAQEENQELVSEKNNRPQHLTLTEESHEATRKINLIGDPGSTPYNNAYSTKDFGKSDASSNKNVLQDTARAISPTYSDISTDSVSNSTSDDTEYNDAVSEIQVDDKEKSEILQNNMVSSVETCRSDVTMDKDFKNNLKTNNNEDGGASSVSNVSKEIIDESGSVEEGNQPGASVDEHEESVNRDVDDSTTEKQTGTFNIGIDWLGKQAPLWIPDNEAMSCLHCDGKFTVIKRRHHCRACGLVLCSKCCNLKYRLEYLDSDARVCKKCYDILNKDTNSSSGSEMSQEPPSPSRGVNQDGPSLGQPNPNNPLEYCSTLPPAQQVEPGASATPSVMVPVGVLKRSGSNKGRSNKSVMFCDGIRPGSDLTALDKDFNYTENQKVEKPKRSPEKSSKIGRNSDFFDPETRSFIPHDEKNLPPTVTIFKSDVKYSPCSSSPSVVEILRNETLIFAIQSNVFIHVKIVNMDCCVSRTVWCFSTEGLINVGQDELVILLEIVENESVVPKDIFIHLNNIYLEAVKGISAKELDLSLHTSSPFLGSKNHAGFVYIRPTYQCVQNLIIPKEPYLVGILIHRWETPWAKLFPLRLVLRLGAEYKYYPSPIISTRDRDSVFVEIGHTIINLLADFRNFSYTLPQIRGLTIHMEDKKTTITIPANRFDQVMKGLCNSSDHILAFAGNFSMKADSHLVCIQDRQSATNNYSTHAINICNQPRKVTGASFIVFNGALKSTSGLTAKSNIVEDGLMIQILPEHMLQVRESLRNMKDHTIKCGCVNEESDETVSIVWGEPDTSFNVGVLSPIDNKLMTGIPSIRVHNGKDYACNSKNRLMRWTEVFIIQNGDESSRNQDPVDISKISESIAKATCQALVKYLDLLVSNSFYKVGLRANLHIENVSYSAGSNNVKLPPIYMKSLDNELIPVLHRITSNNITEQPIILELIFRILNI